MESYKSVFCPSLPNHIREDDDALSLILHLEWSIAHQLFLDFWIASVDANMNKRVTQ